MTIPALPALALFVVLNALVGCAAGKNQPSIPAPVHATDKEFAEGIVQPLFKFMTLLSAYYVQEGKTPRDKDDLSAFAAKAGDSINWQPFRQLKFSNEYDEPTVHVLVVSPSSLSDTGEVVTSWRLALNQTSADPKSLVFRVAPSRTSA